MRVSVRVGLMHLSVGTLQAVAYSIIEILSELSTVHPQRHLDLWKIYRLIWPSSRLKCSPVVLKWKSPLSLLERISIELVADFSGIRRAS